jgi:hypothetical protein
MKKIKWLSMSIGMMFLFFLLWPTMPPRPTVEPRPTLTFTMCHTHRQYLCFNRPFRVSYCPYGYHYGTCD